MKGKATQGMKTFVKDWALIMSILVGILSYFVFVNLGFDASTHRIANQVVSVVQPLLIFAMLFITFCRIDPRDLHFCRWHLWLLLVQVGLFALLGTVLILVPDLGARVEIEGAMLCFICPTATAAAVITRKLGGQVTAVTTYTILINLATALFIPALTPFVHPSEGMDVWTSAMLILGKVFPLLLLPLFAAIAVRYFFPRVHRRLCEMQELSFYLWMVALALAIAVTTRSIVHSEVPVSTQLWLVVISFVCCVLQFYVGRRIGRAHSDTITAQQSLGQKNTVVAIWMGYTFFSPVTAVAGGFYSIWHNVINSWQLYRHNHAAKGQEKIEK